MYDELLKVLRHCGNPNVSCKNCIDEQDCLGAEGAWEIGAMSNMREAANVIEELSRKYTEERNAAVELTGELASKPRWIPVTEFPPEGETYGDTTFSVEVLGTEGFTYRKAYYNFKYKVWLDGNEEQEWPSITYWMYLPDLPKEDEA